MNFFKRLLHVFRFLFPAVWVCDHRFTMMRVVWENDGTEVWVPCTVEVEREWQWLAKFHKDDEYNVNRRKLI